MKIKKNKTTPRQYILENIIGSILLLSALFLQTACSDGGSGGLLAGGGIGGTGISVGEISAFGSVFVNDVEFDTQKAQVIVDGKPVGDGDAAVRDLLNLGMVVRVEGRFQGDGSGTANRIVFNENVKGPITAVEDIDSMIKKITLLGQSVIVDDATIFRGIDFDHLTAGNVLQVSGWTDGKGVIQATYVALITAADDAVSVRGVIAEVNSVQMRINQLLIDYENAYLNGFPTNQPPATGQMVFVTGILDANRILIADEVRHVNDLEVENADDVELEGIVSQFSSSENFVVGTTPIRTDDATVFQGIEPGDIFVGCRLLIKGALTGGRLLADEVIAKDKVNIEGRVDQVNANFYQFVIQLSGLAPLSIMVNDVAKIFGDADKPNDIQTGQHVRILGYVAGADSVQAIQVKVESRSNSKVKLQGPVTAIAKPFVSVLSANVDTDAIPFDGFSSMQDGPISRSDFFNLVIIGDTVSANGKLNGNDVEWEEMEILQE